VGWRRAGTKAMADVPLLGQAQPGKVVGHLAEHLSQGVGVGGEEIVRRAWPYGHRLREGPQPAAAVGELDDVRVAAKAPCGPCDAVPDPVDARSICLTCLSALYKSVKDGNYDDNCTMFL